MYMPARKPQFRVEHGQPEEIKLALYVMGYFLVTEVPKASLNDALNAFALAVDMNKTHALPKGSRTQSLRTIPYRG